MKKMRFMKAALVAAMLATSNLASAATPTLKVKVFNSGEVPFDFAVNSAIVMGEKDAVLVDAQFTLASAHRLVAEILQSGKRLTAIYITHWHPDHFLGLEVIKGAFPEARVLAIPQVAKEINGPYYDFKIKYWGKVLGANGPTKRVQVETLEAKHIDLEGQRLEILGPLQGDMPDSTSVWIPSIRTLIAGDAVYSHQHVWLLDAKTPEERQAWFKALDQFEALKPVMVVPGHSKNNTQVGPESIKFTRNYIQTFAREMPKAKTSRELMAVMNKRFPGLGLPIINDFNTRTFKDGWVWDGGWPQSEPKPR